MNENVSSDVLKTYRNSFQKHLDKHLTRGQAKSHAYDEVEKKHGKETLERLLDYHFDEKHIDDKSHKKVSEQSPDEITHKEYSTWRDIQTQ